MRITLDASPLLVPQTGIGRYTDQLIRAMLARREADIQLMCSYRPWADRGLAAVGEAFGPLGARMRLNPVPNRVLHLAWEAANFPPAEWLGGACDVYHATNFIAPPSGKTAVVATIHDLTPIRFPHWHTAYQKIMGKYLPRSVRRSDRLIADSQATADDLMNYLDVPSEKISVIPLAAAPHFYEPPTSEALLAARGRYGLTGSYFLFIGTLEPRKNLGTLLLAYQKLPADVQSAHPLVLVGSRGWADERLLTTIDALPSVRWLGRVSDVDLPALMVGALGFVYPSYFEGFGLPVLEAMAAGCPVITSNVSSLPEVTGTGPDAAALLVHPDDVAGLSDAMLRLAEEPHLRAELSAKGRARARTFSWDKAAAQTLGVYRELIG